MGDYHVRFWEKLKGKFLGLTYLIAQNGDTRKKTIALVQTRKQELTRQEYEQLSEDEKRLYTRKNVDEIPQDLIQNNKVKFYYRPQFLQGGFCFELLLEMENKEIDDYIEKYKEQVKEIIKVDEANSNDLYDKYGIDLPVIFEYAEGKEFFWK